MKHANKAWRRILSTCLAALLAAATLGSGVASAKTDTVHTDPLVTASDFRETFEEAGGAYTHPTMRYWINVASDPDKVYEEICSIAAGGYGGIEIVPFASKAKYADGSTIGEGDEYAWGTPHWNSLMKAAMEAAVESGIKLDYTISFAWPISSPLIETTADEAAEVSLVTGSQKIPSGTSYTGAVPTGAEWKANAKLLSVTAARVTSERTEAGGGWPPRPASTVYDVENPVDITALAYEDAESACGYSIAYEVPDDGDYVIFGSWESPTESKKNGYLVIDHYGEAGAQAIIDYWVNDVIPAVGEDLFRAASRSIFCDSLEQSGNWSHQMMETFQEEKGYDVSPYLFFLTSSNGLTDSTLVDVVKRDYYDVLTTCFNEYHLKPIREFCYDYGMTLRYQTAYGKTLELASTAANVDIPEGEAMMIRFPIDNVRAQAGAVHTSGKTFYTSELQAESGKTYKQTWDDFLYVVQRHWAAGVNNFTMHGASSSGAFSGNDQNPDNGYLDGVEWPGYEGFGRTSYSNNWNRMPSWEHIKDYTDYIARMNLVLQQGVADVDIAIFRNEYNDNFYEHMNGAKDGSYLYKDEGLLASKGYTYEFVCEDNLALDTSVVKDGVLCADGPAYKALFIHNQSYMSVTAAQRILEYARAGLPIVMIGDAPSLATNLNGLEESTAQLKSLMDELLNLSNVVQVSGYTDVPDALAQMDVLPDTLFSQNEHVLTVHRSSDEADFYYLYNYGLAGQAGRVVAESDYANIQPVDLTVTFNATGVPYLLDAWSGEITPIAQYTINHDGTITLPVSLEGNESQVIAFASPEWGGVDTDIHAAAATGGDVFYAEDGTVMLKSSEAGAYEVQLNDGLAYEVNIDEVAAPIELTRWNLTVKDYCPGDTPIETVYNTIEVGETELKSWTEIEGIENAAGIGTYTTTFTLPETWSETDGAVIDLGRVQDSFRVTVNGTAIPGGNRMTSRVDIGSALVAGENTITVEVATTLLNKVLAVYPNDSRTPDDYGLLGNDGVVTITPYTASAVESAVLSASAPESAQVGSDFAVTVVTAGSVNDVRLYNEYDMMISPKAVDVAENEDGTKTWRLTVSVGTVGDRTFKVVTKGNIGYNINSGKSVSVEITSVAPVLSSFDLPEAAVANRTFIVKATTDMAATKIVVYNEFGAKMGLRSLSYKVVDGQKVWTGVMSVGTKGSRTFTAYAVNKYGAQSDALLDSISVKAYA